MELALNFSVAAETLLRSGLIEIDSFKCPAWPDLVAAASELRPAYVHFPLWVGAGIGDAIDTETHRPADWDRVESLMARTGTPCVNLHLAPTVDDFPWMPAETNSLSHLEMLTESMLEDVQAVVERYGPERVVLENADDGRDRILRPAILPEVICRVVKEAGCGFLLDVAHARLAANRLGLDAVEYIKGLPTDEVRELHLSGVQYFDEDWVDLARHAGLEVDIIQELAGRWIDHLPIRHDDWAFYRWCMEQVHGGAWGKPVVVAFEHGGVGPFWEMTTDREILAEQVSRLRSLVKGDALQSVPPLGMTTARDRPAR